MSIFFFTIISLSRVNVQKNRKMLFYSIFSVITLKFCSLFKTVKASQSSLLI